MPAEKGRTKGRKDLPRSRRKTTEALYRNLLEPVQHFYNFTSISEFGRIFGAKRQKPGFPLQFLGFAYANPAGFSLQCARRRSLSDMYGL
jgi:hypothetical protein